MLFLLSIPFSLVCYGQSISGEVKDEKDNPIPYANIFVRELGTGTAADDKGAYFLTLNVGIYNLVISAVGFETQTLQIILKDKPLVKNFILHSSSIALDEIVVKAKRKDPAYEIIQHVIDHKEKYLKEIKSYKSKVYVKAVEIIDKKEKEKKQGKSEDAVEFSTKGAPMDPFEAEKNKLKSKMDQISWMEMQLNLNYQYPNHFKEERIAYKLYGSSAGLFIPLFNEANVNFYQNLVRLPGISEVPIISPISSTAILSYKYKLEDNYLEGKQIVYKIKVIPRKTGDATCKGYLYINDGSWNIHKLELTLFKGGLKLYDVFTIHQSYSKEDIDMIVPWRQEFTYETKAGQKSFKGSTLLKFSDYQRDFIFPPKFFGNEVSVITKEAYKRDSAYWNSTRMEPLTADEKKIIAYKDSVEAALNDKHYIDSITAKYNKVTVGEVLLHGVGFRNEHKKSNLYLNSLAGLIGFEVIGGFRLGPMAHYFRKFENGRMLSTFASVNVGIKNVDPQWSLNTWLRYDPIKLAEISVRTGRAFYSINSFDAYLNQLKISNYILHDHIDVYHRFEVFNGFYLRTEAGYHQRQSVRDYNKSSIINEIIDEDTAYSFNDYETFFTNVRLSYTPFQRYMTEPTQKVVLGSKYPTFSIGHKRGWNGVLGSDVKFDFVDFSIEQNLLLGVLGNSRYSFTIGKFVDTTKLEFIDVKRFRQSDPYLYSDPLHSFQLLDTSLNTKNWYIEAHYIHHFNGAMINNIPLIKKTKIRTVVGAGAMYIKESNYRHTEVFGGIERVFKMGARRRLRLGVYGVLGQSNNGPLKTGYKISFDIIDAWKRDWSF